MKTDELREKYLDFFKSKGHTVCPSDVLVPKWDKTVLFTPAGMNQFKDHFLGKVELDFTKATTSQKCLRTGDIENVGRTAYHHTFFEMLGNFSFGDYFKTDAIHWAWEFLTDKNWLGIDPERLSVTVYLDDDEAANIWHNDIGLPEKRIVRLDEAENFWPASSPSKGPDGVCGPCSEIFFQPDDGPECEIWNLVFTQFNRNGDPPDNLEPLPSKNIDTGMGLERTAAVLQGCSTNFHIDTLLPIVEAAAEVCGVKYEPETDNGRRLRRITDHVRACSLAIHENVYPGSQKEESVVRLLLRRAVLQGYDMGLRDPFLHQLVPVVVDQLKRPYPELTETVTRVADAIKTEEEGFYGVIERGIPLVEEIVRDSQESGAKVLDPDAAARVFQTHGVPPSISESVAESNGLGFDWAAFDEAMDRHGKISNTGEKGVMGDSGPLDEIKRAVKSTPFLGYESITANGEICGLIDGFESDEVNAEKLTSPNALQVVVTNETPFYAESGGQVGDTGMIVGPNGKFEVSDTQKTGDVFYHIGKVIEGHISIGDPVSLEVDSSRRDGIRRAHSATHILHYALQQNLGKHAQQRGSKVSEDHLRFDFAQKDLVDSDTLDTIEQQTLQKIEAGDTVVAETLPLEKARELGAMMLFGEKYPDPVRMVSIGEFSRELCGGIHVANASDIAALEIIVEEKLSSGTRRIQALTGNRAKAFQEQVAREADELCELLGVSLANLPNRVGNLSSQVKALKKQLSSGKESQFNELPLDEQDAAADYFSKRTALRKIAQLLNTGLVEVAERVKNMVNELERLSEDVKKLAASADIDVDQLVGSAEQIGETNVIVQSLPGVNAGLMRKTIDQIRKKADRVAVMLLTSSGGGKVVLAAGLSRELVDQGLHAGKWIGEVAPIVGGRGGGKPDFAQAGGADPAKIDEAIEVAKNFIKAKQTG